MGKNSTTVRELIDRLTRRAVMVECNVKTQAVTNWIANDRIPTDHYLAFRNLCAQAQEPVPDHLFFGEAA